MDTKFQNESMEVRKRAAEVRRNWSPIETVRRTGLPPDIPTRAPAIHSRRSDARMECRRMWSRWRQWKFATIVGTLLKSRRLLGVILPKLSQNAFPHSKMP